MAGWRPVRAREDTFGDQATVDRAKPAQFAVVAEKFAAADRQHFELAQLFVFGEIAGRQGDLEKKAAVGAVDEEVNPAQARQRFFSLEVAQRLIKEGVHGIDHLFEGHKEEGGPLTVEHLQGFAAAAQPAIPACRLQIRFGAANGGAAAVRHQATGGISHLVLDVDLGESTRQSQIADSPDSPLRGPYGDREAEGGNQNEGPSVARWRFESLHEDQNSNTPEIKRKISAVGLGLQPGRLGPDPFGQQPSRRERRRRGPPFLRVHFQAKFQVRTTVHKW